MNFVSNLGLGARIGADPIRSLGRIATTSTPQIAQTEGIPMTNENSRVAGSERSIDRRAAIKRGVAGAAAAGVVWSAPRIEGLSLRPSYAAAQSSPGVTVTFNTFDQPGTFNPLTGDCWGPASVIKAQSKDFELKIPVNTGTLNVAVVATPYSDVTLEPGNPYVIKGKKADALPSPPTLMFNFTCI